jgi:hypothetical protein
MRGQALITKFSHLIIDEDHTSGNTHPDSDHNAEERTAVLGQSSSCWNPDQPFMQSREDDWLIQEAVEQFLHQDLNLDIWSRNNTAGILSHSDALIARLARRAQSQESPGEMQSSRHSVPDDDVLDQIGNITISE